MELVERTAALCNNFAAAAQHHLRITAQLPAPPEGLTDAQKKALAEDQSQVTGLLLFRSSIHSTKHSLNQANSHSNHAQAGPRRSQRSAPCTRDCETSSSCPSGIWPSDKTCVFFDCLRVCLIEWMVCKRVGDGVCEQAAHFPHSRRQGIVCELPGTAARTRHQRCLHSGAISSSCV